MTEITIKTVSYDTKAGEVYMEWIDETEVIIELRSFDETEKLYHSVVILGKAQIEQLMGFLKAGA